MKTKIGVAARPLKPKDFSRNHYTTLGFGSPFPVYVEETIARDKFNFRILNFSRLAPMLLPNLGTIDMKIHAFYVPFHLVWNHFENFVTGLPSWNSHGAQVYKHVPMIDDYSLTYIFTTFQADPSLALSEVVNNVSDLNPYDFSLQTGNTFTYYKFTSRGKQILHMLQALGYNFNFVSSSSSSLNSRYSALPLLCWLKVFLDYFIPSQLQPSSAINQLLSTIHDMTASEMESVLNIQLLDSLLNEIFVYYQNNYFTSAWQSPNEVVSGLNHIGSTSSDNALINSISQQGPQNPPSGMNQQTRSTSTGVFGPTSGTLSADGITFMQKFAKYVKRSNFAGSRAIERILARFGVRIDDFQIGMCKYLGSDTVSLQKSDVVVTGNTEEAGDYTGKGFFSGGSRTFKCDCDFAGLIICTASLEVPSVFVDGVRRRNLHMQPLDFYTPELDGGLMQAISGQELFSRCYDENSGNYDALNEMGLLRNSVFGFSPRYAEYKNGASIDDVTGDFALPRYQNGIDGFILPRRIFNQLKAWQSTIDDPTNVNGNLVESSYQYDGEILKFMSPVQSLLANDMSQFNRIFRDIEGDADPVFSVFRIDCVVQSCSIPLNESAELIGKGKVLAFETNGVHV